MISTNTPIEQYAVQGRRVYVKREDLCVPDGWPPFSKMRGSWSYLTKLYREGVRTVAYAGTSISMTSWGVAAAAAELGMKAIIFDPQLKKCTPEPLQYYRQQWKKYGAEVLPIIAHKAKVVHYIARKVVVDKYPDATLLPIGMSLPESVVETGKEFVRTGDSWGSIVINVSSGTICAGILSVLGRNSEVDIFAVASEKHNTDNLMKSMLDKAGIVDSCDMKLYIINGKRKYGYRNRETCDCPFSCNTYYDRKAWRWLVDNINQLSDPILFWNIGGEV